jgi:hypothetical protein
MILIGKQETRCRHFEFKSIRIVLFFLHLPVKYVIWGMLRRLKFDHNNVCASNYK